MSFDAAIAVVLKHEGGYVNSKIDSGGSTKYGITHHTLAAWRKVPDCSPEEVEALTLDQAKEIYKSEYWDKMGLDEVKSPLLQAFLFDQGVLNGPQTTLIKLQAELKVKADGVMGPVTSKAINEYSSDGSLAALMLLDLHRRHIEIVLRDHSQLGNLLGWTNRFEEMIRECL